MRAVFVNYCHPETPHVCSVRLPSFARAMASRGHKIVLVTKTLRVRDPGTAPEAVPELVAGHDWSSPLLMTIKPLTLAPLEATRNGTSPAFVRRTLTAWYLLARGGVYADWSEAARAIERPLAQHFRPEAIWATFLPTDSLVIARRLAIRACCPWVADLKDSWAGRLPRGTRHVIARRFRDVARVTSNSRLHAEHSQPWLRKMPVTIYDGVDEAFLQHQVPALDGLFRIVLVGSTYGRRRLERFFRALHSWLDALRPEERQAVRFVYAGADHALVRTVLSETGLLAERCEIAVHDYLTIRRLAALCSEASANMYLWLPTGFSHKLLELLACGRPVVAFPGEHRESTELASQLGGELHACGGEEQLARTLDRLWERRRRDPRPGRPREALRPFTWEAQAKILEETLLGGSVPREAAGLGA